MSCENSTAPINITSPKNALTCNLKCSYKFDYANSNCTVENMDDYISLSYDKRSKSITFNKIELYVQEIRLYCPSLHTYNGKKTAAEILIIHGGMGTNLIVSVPITIGTKISNGSQIFDFIINKGLSNIPNVGESATLGMDNYNLGHIIPSKPFFSYSGTLLYGPCNGKYNYIVFEKINSIQLNKTTIERLRKIIKPFNAPIRNKVEPFYNKLGSNAKIGDGDGEIYIECHPTGSDGEVLLYQGKIDDSSSQFEDFIQSPIFKLLTAISIMVVSVGVFKMVAKKFSNDK